MNFFRLRLINTLLLFLIGTVLGFMLKEKFYPSRDKPVQPVYRSSYPEQSQIPPAARSEYEGSEDQGEEPTDEPYAMQDFESGADTRPGTKDAYPETPARQEPAALLIEASAKSEPATPPRHAASEARAAGFFADPASYEGRELQLELQMITAKRSERGWRLNLVYTGPDRKINYLYIDDAELLGEKPELLIGYVYKVGFRCLKGETASGNSLLKIEPTGEKAAWATGLSAIE